MSKVYVFSNEEVKRMYPYTSFTSRLALEAISSGFKIASIEVGEINGNWEDMVKLCTEIIETHSCFNAMKGIIQPKLEQGIVIIAFDDKRNH